MSSCFNCGKSNCTLKKCLMAHIEGRIQKNKKTFWDAAKKNKSGKEKES